MKLLIGSRAIKYWFKDFPREPKDWDYIGETPKWKDKGIEYHKNPVFRGYKKDVMGPDDLYNLKISHLFWDISWDKHMFDVMFLRDKGCKFDRKLFDKLYKYWTETHTKVKKSNLMLSADDFFDNAVGCPIEHDTIHEILNPYPTYKKIAKNDGTVATDDDKFEALSHEEKMDLIREECMVMAYERLGGRDFRSAYKWMLKKLILGHLPIVEGLFAIMNYKELHLPKINYVKKIEEWQTQNQKILQ
jgi:hypothetical protein